MRPGPSPGVWVSARVSVRGLRLGPWLARSVRLCNAQENSAGTGGDPSWVREPAGTTTRNSAQGPAQWVVKDKQGWEEMPLSSKHPGRDGRWGRSGAAESWGSREWRAHTGHQCQATCARQPGQPGLDGRGGPAPGPRGLSLPLPGPWGPVRSWEEYSGEPSGAPQGVNYQVGCAICLGPTCLKPPPLFPRGMLGGPFPSISASPRGSPKPVIKRLH